MTWSFTPISGIFLFSCFVSILVAIQASGKKNMPGALAFVLWICAVAEWNFASAIEIGMVDVSQKILWAKIEYLGSLSAPILFMIFALEYSQRNSLADPAEPAVAFFVVGDFPGHRRH